MLETFKDQVSSIESRVSRNKAFSNMQKRERVSRKQFISRRENNTAHTYIKIQVFRVDRYCVKTFEFKLELAKYHTVILGSLHV